MAGHGKTHERTAGVAGPSARVSDRTMTHDPTTDNDDDASRTNYEPQWIPEGRPEVSGPDIDAYQDMQADVFKLRERGEPGAWIQSDMSLAVELGEWE